MASNENSDIVITNQEGLEFLNELENNSVDLILTDPPYITSRISGMDTHYNNVKESEKNNKNIKKESDWKKYIHDILINNKNLLKLFIKNIEEKEEWHIHKNIFKEDEYTKLKSEINTNDNTTNNIINTNDTKVNFTDISVFETQKENYIKYGSIYGKKYCVKTDYGDWDSNFNMEILDQFISEFYKKLKKGGTLIIFFDIWKITSLKDILEKYKFKQIRFIEWIKTNPQPLNSKTNYLTNCREIALVAVKNGKPTFNSSYDKGIYEYPLQGGKNRFHPTQKSLALFEDLINKHSNINDLVVDPFLGSGTTAIACKNTKRKFKGCEISTEYYNKILEIIQ